MRARDSKRSEEQRRAERARANRGRRAEEEYARQLRQIARHIGSIIRAFSVGDPASLPLINEACARYAEVLRPWSVATGRRMLEDVSNRDKAAWATHANAMARALKAEIDTAPTGVLMREMLERQVGLITSLPLEAAQRVHKLTMEGLVSSQRAGEVAKEILRSGDVTVSRANLIARTEVARTASTLTQARALQVGSTGYIWRTSGDASVRPSHRKMEGKPVLWSAKPVLDGMVGHAGEFPNCRCYPEVILPKSFD